MKKTVPALLIGFLAVTAAFAQAPQEKAAEPAATQSDELSTVHVTVTIVEAPPSKLPTDGPAELLQERIRKLEGSKELLSLVRVRMSCVEGHDAFIQYGERLPLVSSSTSVRGTTLNRYNIQNVGALVGCTAQVEGQTIIAKLNIEQSRVIHPKVEMEEREESGAKPPPTISTLTSKTTVKITDCSTVVLGGKRVQTSDGDHRQSLILVTAKILD